ncbi:MAG: hypothetical protein A3F13_03960 [Gammaproteobacteria bacterium RIFCSPHIGHO2_12_FULL_40_19]|nr:MAG: hypothetical protein A3F13_03955 [Gammaproteobacteria bacterium RIFCSPHIGHO2_12_FULL_40_19]OGT41674.1 MAG: hypothetical protein A3F13_03960 [Gammaproteobacteria bacterium RIFCSPHIGHO2_12_FULL_40_19]
MDILRGKTPEMVRKEIWAHILAYNLVRKMMAQAAVMYEKNPRQLSFKLAFCPRKIMMCMTYFFVLLHIKKQRISLEAPLKHCLHTIKMSHNSTNIAQGCAYKQMVMITHQAICKYLCLISVMNLNK